MKRLLLLGALMGAIGLYSLAAAADEGIEARRLALQYHDRCLDSIYTDLTPAARADFCACSAEAARTALRLPELQKLATGVGPALDEDRVAVEIFAPCAGIPLGELEYQACLDKPLYRRFLQTQPAYEKMCGCVRDAVLDYIGAVGRDLGAYVLRRYPSKDSIVLKMQRSVEFQEEVGEQGSRCLNEFAYK